MTEDLGAVAIYDQYLAAGRDAHPGHTQEWYDAWIRRMVWYLMHQGDMSECTTEMPEN